MGNGIVREAQDLDSFKKFSHEYDRMRMAGLSAEEIHTILCTRIEKTHSIISNDTVNFSPSKDSGDVRHAESTKENSIRNSVPAVRINDNAQSAPVGKKIELESPIAKAKPITEVKPVAADSSQDIAPNKPIASSKPMKAKTVGLALLIDDSAVAAKVASKVLVNANFDVVTANSAKMGFDILLGRKHEIDIIFLDVVMPNVDGVECLSWIKDNAEVSHIPVYMLSGLEDQMLAEVCVERGAEGMLLKPLNTETAKTIIRSHGIGEVSKSDEKETEETNTPSAPAEVPSTIIRPPPLKIDSSNSGPIPVMEKTVSIDKVADSAVAATKGKKSGNTVNNAPTHVHPYATIATATAPNTTVGGLVPAFKLVDSEFEEFIFPSTSTASTKKLTLLLFIPTVYCSALYEEDGFLMRFFHNYDMLVHTKQVTVACVSGDLPFALSAAKTRFRIPFTLLSDPSLFVTQKIIGAVNIGPALAYQELKERFAEEAEEIEVTPAPSAAVRSKLRQESDAKKKSDLPYEVLQQILSISTNPQQMFYAPRLGMVLLNKRREVLNQWLCPLPPKQSSLPGQPFHPKDVNLRQFPPNFKDWIVLMSKGGVTGDTNGDDDDDTTDDQPKQRRRNSAFNSNISSKRETFTSSSSLVIAPSSNNQQGAYESKERDRADTLSEQQRLLRQRDTAIAASVPVVEEAPAPPEKIAILVIDDSSVSSRVVCKKLENLGYAVNAAYDGQKGYEMLRKRALNYAMVLCDVVMPICDGIGFLKLVKNDEAVKHIPIVMLSGLEGEELSKSCIDLGAFALLKKPFDDHTFSEIVAQLGIQKHT